MRSSQQAPHRGRSGETLAIEYLVEAHGYRLLQRNYRCPGGEIDLIAYDGPVLAFIEVKTRSRRWQGAAWEAIDGRKRERIRRAARHFLACHSEHARASVRFDVVCVFVNSGGFEYQLLRDAFRDE